MNAVFSDPSYESHQPSWVRHSLRYGLRRLVICPAGGFEEVDGGEEGPIDELEAMEMETFVANDDDHFTVSMKVDFCLCLCFMLTCIHRLQSLLPGMDNTLGCYIKYHLVVAEQQPAEMGLSNTSSKKMWFVLTYSSLVGYPHHNVCYPLPIPHL